jgi:dihydrofolate reductase
MILSLISAIGNNNEIGKKNDLLWDLPADMKHFRETTSGHPVIMGQKTFESLGRTPTGEQVGKPLPNRRNIVISREADYTAPGIEIVHSIDEAIELCKKSENHDEEFFVIGGGEIYRQMIVKADKLYITHVDASFPDAEVFFPAIDSSIWKETSREDHEADEKNAFPYSFVTYKKTA